MTRELIGTGMISIVVVIALAIFLSNRKLRARQESLFPKPTELVQGELLASCFYVSTCLESDPLKRIWAHGLGHRGKVDLLLSDETLGFDRKGEAGFSIPISELSMIGNATATIDKGVEADGLITLHWLLGTEKVLTNLRVVDQKIRAKTQRKLESLIGAVDA
jgi:hypothetical protein